MSSLPLGSSLTPRALRRWRSAVTACFALGGMTIAAWGPRLPAIKASLGLSAGTIGLILGGATVGSMAGVVASAPARKLLGPRGSISGATLLVAAALLTMSVGVAAESVPVLSAGFVLVGLGVGSLDVLINVEGAQVERLVARTLMPMLHAAWSIGVAAGAGIGAACETLDITPGAQFAGEALLMTGAGLAMNRLIPGRGEDPPESTQHGRTGVRRLLRQLDRRLLAIGLVMLGVELGEGSANSWLSLSVADGHGRTAKIAALMYVVFAVGEAAARLAGGPVVDRIGRARAVRYTASLGAAGVLLFVSFDHPAALVCGVVLWAVGVSMGFPLGMSAAATGPNAAVRVSVVASIGYVANLAGPPVIGALADHYGLLRALFLVVGFLALAAAIAPALSEDAQD